jgi:hypothetical protein
MKRFVDCERQNTLPTPAAVSDKCHRNIIPMLKLKQVVFYAEFHSVGRSTLSTNPPERLYTKWCMPKPGRSPYTLSPPKGERFRRILIRALNPYT